MPLKKFRETTVQGALRATREALGPDALVIGTELVSAQGWRGWLGAREVEVTASAAPSATPSATPSAAPSNVSARRPSRVDRRDPDASLRDGVVARLVASGIERSLAHAIVARLEPMECRGSSTASIRRTLADHLTDLIATDEGFARVEVFVGPPGVGKTTTIAKIAAQTRARHGKTLGMVAADAFRAGAIEQLRTYADIIGAPFRIARTADELDKLLAGGRQPVLVDTAGRSPADPNVRDTLRLLGRRHGVRTHLVIAADTSEASARRVFDAYEDARPERLVITKMDEADSISPLLSVVRERQLPISYVTAGQRMPEDLERATPALLAAALLRDRHAEVRG